MVLIPVPPGELATVVTYLEMSERPRPAPLPASPLRLERWPTPEPHAYRALFRKVGARWLWFSRLAKDDDALAAMLSDPGIEVHAVVWESDQVGMVELDFRDPGRCELTYLALVPELAGKGHGRGLLARTLALAWRPGVTRVKVQTCTLDHPAALPAYLRAGFVVTRRAIETFPDPRDLGLLDPADAPQVARLGATASRR